jgi:hypothetical protein
MRSDRAEDNALPGAEVVRAVMTATVVKVLPTRIWIESGIMGERVVVAQHEGYEPFDYATFWYDYRYTSNMGTWDAARNLAIALGAVEPVEERHRGFDAALQELLSAPEQKKAGN